MEKIEIKKKTTQNRARRLCSNPQSSLLDLCVGVVFPPPPCLSTSWRWVPSASASFDTESLGSLSRRVFRHVGTGIPPPPCLSTRSRWVPSAAVSFDKSALGSLHLRIFRHGSLHLRVFRHVGAGIPPPPRLPTRSRWVPSASVPFDTLALGSLRLRRWVVGLPPCLVRGGLAALSCGSCGHPRSVTRGWARRVILWDAVSSWGTFRRFHQWEGG